MNRVSDSAATGIKHLAKTWERRKNDLSGGSTTNDLDGVGILIPP